MKKKFRRIASQQQNFVYSLAMHLLRRPHDAEDIVQEVFLKLWHNIGQVEEERAGAWLSTVTRNLCIDRLRGSKREALENPEHFETPDKRVQPDQALEDSRLSTWLRDAIAELREPYKSLIVMCDLQQRDQKEVAEILGISPNQVKVYAFRARQQLKANLNE